MHYGVSIGNCLFNALSDQIFGDQSKNHEIRAAVIKHMRDNADDYKPFVPVERGGGQRRNPKRKNAGAFSTPFNNEPATLEEIDRNFEVHLERMAKGGTYGDNLEIRAFSRAYNTDVKIYNYDNAYYVRAADDGAVRPIAHVAYHVRVLSLSLFQLKPRQLECALTFYPTDLGALFFNSKY